MNIEQRIKVIEDFLIWLDSCTYYEIGEDIQSDYGDGQSYFHRVNNSGLLNEYRLGFMEDKK